MCCFNINKVKTRAVEGRRRVPRGRGGGGKVFFGRSGAECFFLVYLQRKAACAGWRNALCDSSLNCFHVEVLPCNGAAKRESRVNRELSRNCNSAISLRQLTIGPVGPEKVRCRCSRARRPALMCFVAMLSR